MFLIDDGLVLSATDLVGHLHCRHLTQLGRSVALGDAAMPRSWDPALELLWERGARFEQEYRDHLAASGLTLVTIPGINVQDEAIAATLREMHAGTGIIIQGALASGRWRGRADVLSRVEIPSDLGPWSYEVLDTKLARETKSGAVLQLCLYSELLSDMQGTAPERAYVRPAQGSNLAPTGWPTMPPISGM